MEETDTAKEWFVTREGKQFGPVSYEDLKFEVGRGELNPRLDRVWKEGMGDWIPAGELEGLFVKNEDAKGADPGVRTSGTFTTYAPPETEEELERIKGNWPGVGRGSYFAMAFLFPLIVGAGSGALRAGFGEKLGTALLDNISSGLFLVCIVISIIVSLKRFQNLGMSRWWYLASYVPFLFPWLEYRLFACPPGYATHKKLDGLGWFLAFLFWIPFLLIALAAAYVAYLLTQSPPDDSHRLMIEGFVEKFGERWKEVSKTGEKP